MKRLILLIIFIASAFCSFGQHTRTTKAYADTLESQNDAQITVSSSITFTTITASEIYTVSFTADYGGIDSAFGITILRADDDYFTTITVTYAQITDLDVTNDLYAVSVTADDGTISNLFFTNGDGDSLLVVDLYADNSYLTTITSTYGSFTDLDVSNDLYALSVTAGDATFTNLNFTNGDGDSLLVIDLYADNAYLTTITSSYVYTTSITALDGTITNINFTNGNGDSLLVVDLHADNAWLTTVTSVYVSVTNIDVVQNLTADSAYIRSLTADSVYSVSITSDFGTFTDLAVDYLIVNDSIGSSTGCVPIIYAVSITSCSPTILESGIIAYTGTITNGGQVELMLSIDSINALTDAYIHLKDSLYIGTNPSHYTLPAYYGGSGQGLFLSGNVMKWGDHRDTFRIQFSGSYQTVTDGSTVMLSDSATFGEIYSDNITSDDSTTVTCLGTVVNYTVTFTSTGQTQNTTLTDSMITVNTPGMYFINSSLSGVGTNDSIDVWVVVTVNDVEQTNINGKLTFHAENIKSISLTGMVSLSKGDMVKLTFRGANENFYLRSANLNAIKLD